MGLDNGFLRWDPNGVQFDPTIMERQGKIEAGSLFGDMKATYPWPNTPQLQMRRLGSVTHLDNMIQLVQNTSKQASVSPKKSREK
jgi:hypothetical protein